MAGTKYLEGFIPYSRELIREYTETRAWENLTYGDILDRVASQHPDNIAVVDDRNRLTYRELKDQVDRFAIALLQLGLKSHDRVTTITSDPPAGSCEAWGLLLTIVINYVNSAPYLSRPRFSRSMVSGVGTPFSSQPCSL